MQRITSVFGNRTFRSGSKSNNGPQWTMGEMHRLFGMEDNNKRIPYPLVAHFSRLHVCLSILMKRPFNLHMLLNFLSIFALLLISSGFHFHVAPKESQLVGVRNRNLRLQICEVHLVLRIIKSGNFFLAHPVFQLKLLERSLSPYNKSSVRTSSLHCSW